MRRDWVIAGIGLLSLVAGGCQNSVADERDKLYKQNQELQAKVDEMKTRPAAPSADPQALRLLQDQLAAKEAEIAALKGAPLAPVAPAVAPAGLEGLDTAVDSKGNIRVNLASDVLFDTGKAELKPSAKAVLDKVAAALTKQHIGKEVRVEGHTDTDPITKSKDKWNDNLDLSQERAANVTRYLVQQKVEAKRIGTVGYGEWRPKGGNKDANRRVEIIVLK